MDTETGGVSKTCPQCQGQRVDVRVAIGGAGQLHAVRFNRLDRTKGLTGIVGIVGVCCTSCGLLQLYASDAERLTDS